MALRRTEACGPLLVVDDDASLRAFVREVLLHAGYSVWETDSGPEAVDLVQRERPALVILDIQLPVLSGYEVCRRLLDAGSPPPILFISGERTDALDRVAGLLLGADDYLVKPFSADELLARVRTCPDSPPQEREWSRGEAHQPGARRECGCSLRVSGTSRSGVAS